MNRQKLTKYFLFLLCIALIFILIYFDMILLNSSKYFISKSEDSKQKIGIKTPKKIKSEIQKSIALKIALASTLRLIPGLNDAFGSQNCAEFSSEYPPIKKALRWKFSEALFRRRLYRNAMRPSEKCKVIRKRLLFLDQPLSEEERDFPLAYGMVVHTSAIQAFLLLSAIYQPQNAYCIAVDEKSANEFKRQIYLLEDCFPNIFIMQTPNVHWCGYSVVRAVFGCLRHLSELDHKWKYYQYLSGVDLPLKTNLEMVRIFKQLNGTANTEVSEYQVERLMDGEDDNPPLPLWKSSLSAVFSRETANAIVRSEKARELLLFLQQTYCPDESIWTTITGNIKSLNIPGSFDAEIFYQKIAAEKEKIKEIQKNYGYDFNLSKKEISTLEEPFHLKSYYISRYQVWPSEDVEDNCKGIFKRGSCVFGVGDLTTLLKRPEFVAHKFYLNFQPAAYFCLYKTIRERAFDVESQRKFKGEAYAKLPQVKLAHGANIHDVQFFFDFRKKF